MPDRTFGGITVPKFTDKSNRLFASLLERQLGFAGQAEAGLDPGVLATNFLNTARRGIDTSTGLRLTEQTGDPGAGAAFDLAQTNRVTGQYNDLLAFLNSPQGAAELAKAKAGLYGPGNLTSLQLFGAPGPSQPSQINQLLGVGAAAGGLGWSPFG